VQSVILEDSGGLQTTTETSVSTTMLPLSPNQVFVVRQHDLAVAFLTTSNDPPFQIALKEFSDSSLQKCNLTAAPIALHNVLGSEEVLVQTSTSLFSLTFPTCILTALGSLGANAKVRFSAEGARRVAVDGQQLSTTLASEVVENTATLAAAGSVVATSIDLAAVDQNDQIVIFSLDTLSELTTVSLPPSTVVLNLKLTADSKRLYVLEGTSSTAASGTLVEYAAPCTSGAYAASFSQLWTASTCTLCPSGTFGDDSLVLFQGFSQAQCNGRFHLTDVLASHDQLFLSIDGSTTVQYHNDDTRSCFVTADNTLLAHRVSTNIKMQTSACQACPVGLVTPRPGQPECSACPTGQHRAADSTVECVEACPRGHFLNTSSNTCYTCPINTFTTSPDALECTPCPSGSTSPAASSSPGMPLAI
jgi:hypothetical protein